MAEDIAAPAGANDNVSASANDNAPAEPAETLFGLPMDVFVKGGTTRSAHDLKVKGEWLDAERRRDIADAEKKLARANSLASGNQGDVANVYNHEFTEHAELPKAYVQLKYLSRNGKDVDFMGVGDIIMPDDPAFPNELALLIYCPKCMGRLPADQCILTIRQSNRYWELDRRFAGELFVDDDGTSYFSAGKVRDGEKFTCGRCAWQARIDDNNVITY